MVVSIAAGGVDGLLLLSTWEQAVLPMQSLQYAETQETP